MNLSELIQRVLDEEGLYYSDLIRRAAAAGYDTSKAALSKIVNREVRNFPKPETIFMLSAALHRSPGVVMNAACQSFGIVIHHADLEDDPVIVAERPLSPDELAVRRQAARRGSTVTSVVSDSPLELTDVDVEVVERPEIQPHQDDHTSS